MGRGMAQLNEQKIFLRTEKELNAEQKEFVRNYFEEEVSSDVIPLMIENIPEFPALRDKSIYLGCGDVEKRKCLEKEICTD